MWSSKKKKANQDAQDVPLAPQPEGSLQRRESRTSPGERSRGAPPGEQEPPAELEEVPTVDAEVLEDEVDEGEEETQRGSGEMEAWRAMSREQLLRCM